MSSCPIFFVIRLKIRYRYIIQSRRSFCASPSCRPQLRFGLQSLDSAQKDSFLLFMIYSAVVKVTFCSVEMFNKFFGSTVKILTNEAREGSWK
jgi:hypothetical protein